MVGGAGWTLPEGGYGLTETYLKLRLCERSHYRPEEIDAMQDRADPMLDLLMAYNRLRMREEARRDELLAALVAGGAVS